MSLPEQMAQILTHAGHKEITELQMCIAWNKLRDNIHTLNPSIEDIGEALQNLTPKDKLHIANILSATRIKFAQITNFPEMASPLFALMKKPLKPITREQHIELRKQLAKYGKLMVYLLYPSISIAIYAEAALATDWPSETIIRNSKDEPVGGLAFEYRQFCKDVGAASSDYRLRVGILNCAADINKGTLSGHGVKHPFFAKLVSMMPDTEKPLKEYPRGLYQGTVIFGKKSANGLYDVNNIVTLKGDVISSYGAELRRPDYEEDEENQL